MTIPYQTLKEIASLGGGFIINASTIPYITLKEIASCASNGKGYITLKNVATIPYAILKEISSLGNGHVIFDLTD